MKLKITKATGICEYAERRDKACAACSGWFCVINGVSKKIEDIEICKDKETMELCTRYINAKKLLIDI